MGGVTLVAVLYALVSLAFLQVAPADASGSDDIFVSVVGAVLFGPAAGRLLAAMVTVAVAGSLAAVLLGAPRVYLAMARDGLFPERVARFDPRRGSSPGATLVQVSLACVLVLLGTFDQILGYFVPAAVFFLGLSAAAVLVLPRPARVAGSKSAATSARRSDAGAESRKEYRARSSLTASRDGADLRSHALTLPAHGGSGSQASR